MLRIFSGLCPVIVCTILCAANSGLILPRTNLTLISRATPQFAATPGRRTFIDNVEQGIWYIHHGQMFRNFQPVYIRASPSIPDVGGVDAAGPSSATNEPSSWDPEDFTTIQLVVGRNDIFGRPQRLEIDSSPEIWGAWQHPKYVPISEQNDSPTFSWGTLKGSFLLRRKAMDLVDAANLARDFTTAAPDYRGPWRAVEVFFDKGRAEGLGGPQIVYRFTAGRHESDALSGASRGVDVLVKKRMVEPWKE